MLHAIIRRGRRLHDDILLPAAGQHGVIQALRRGDRYQLHALRRSDMHRSGEQCNPRAAVTRGLGQGVAHLAGGVIGEIAHRSMRSTVGPAVTSTRRPSMSRARHSRSHTACTMASGSLMRPAPLSPQARCPLSGPTVLTPRASKVRRFCCVASAVHMPVFMAGASKMGAFVASSVVVSMSSAMPQASLAIRLAVAGATSITSAFCARIYA